MFFRPENHINAGKDVGDSGIGNITDDAVGATIADSIVDNETINGVQARIIALMRENPRISANQLAQEIGIAQRSIQVHIKSLKNRRLISREGAAFGGSWIVNAGH